MNENPDDSFAQRLSRLTPTPATLDRDALLFAAGRASVRGRRPLMALAGALAASQLLTLVVLWPRAPLQPAEPFSAGELVAVAEQETVAAAPYQFSEMRQRLLSADGDIRPDTADGYLAPDDPPLRAFEPSRAESLN